MSNVAASHEGFSIPLINFSAFLNGTPEERTRTAKEILHGFKTAGFIYLHSLPLSPSQRQQVFDASANYFSLSLETKLSHLMPSVESNRGYSANGQEKLGSEESPDIKETLHIGREKDPKYPNIWPAEIGRLVGFKDTIGGFFDFCTKMVNEVMRAIAVGLGIDENYFEEYMSDGDHKLRLLHYPEVSTEVFQSNVNKVRAGAHTDYGAITLLFQDSRGGLQVKTPTGEYANATPIENTVVVNAGDLLARWSNDLIKSTVHRVVEPPLLRKTYCRFFGGPHEDSYIDAIPGTFVTDADKKYKGVKSGQYYIDRLTATY
ncbi:hypothetical protein BGW36DRAFT_399914 [Talaromyces proteolyticus]|uniref:Fe2OG dioxygenase domain-containing protein n=1 Tax=Talaromyces proteolyticus TaxID=1131652 RepID=A0AAD4KKC5_9EURO|nr:uncharacterized protein BGW36DRAFT_399914 [Talaromyces proteolyticus]KAH8693206.1 hypothetical protein BGW36DRAFT_399914 [Talaromyces proteolyticus]